VREAVTIPYNKAVVSGEIHFNALNSDTKRAWLRATAAVAKGLQIRENQASWLPWTPWTMSGPKAAQRVATALYVCQ